MTPSARSRLLWLLWLLAYNALLPLLMVALRVAALCNAKLRETLAGHRGLWARLRAALAARDPARALLWFHVASAGEFLQALPVLERCLGAGHQCVLTVTSVSGYRWAQRRIATMPGVLAVDYLPLDTPFAVRRLLRLLRPSALVFTKYDLWPNLVWGAARARVPQFLLSATLHARSWRHRSAPARSFYATLYELLAGIFAVTEADAQRFRAAVPRHAGVQVLGDTRFDSVLDRRDSLPAPPIPPYSGGGALMVVGSSWPADEEHTVPALRDALERYSDLHIVLVPHEVHHDQLERLESQFAAVPVVRFSRINPDAPAPWRVLLVDAVGVLSSLYAHATVAYVGGGFSTGVHNVMEPAAVGAPPIFGPFHQNSPEALHLIEQGLGMAIEDGAHFRRTLKELLDDPARAAALGAQARAYVESQAGAAQRAFEHIQAALATQVSSRARA